MAETEDKWFKSRRYGWGWRPASWQGWVILVIYVGLLIGWLALTNAKAESNGFKAITFIMGAVVISLPLIAICYKKGEPPTWRWGDRDKTKANQP